MDKDCCSCCCCCSFFTLLTTGAFVAALMAGVWIQRGRKRPARPALEPHRDMDSVCSP